MGKGNFRKLVTEVIHQLNDLTAGPLRNRVCPVGAEVGVELGHESPLS